MGEQIRIEEKAHFYTDEKKIPETYARAKKQQGYKVKTEVTQPKGYIVTSTIWIDLQSEISNTN